MTPIKHFNNKKELSGIFELFAYKECEFNLFSSEKLTKYKKLKIPNIKIPKIDKIIKII
jgi:hypothetical protein